MRRLDAVWYFNGAVLTDQTSALGKGTSLTVNAGDKVYLGSEEWLAGAYFETSVLSGSPDYVIEQYTDGSWKELPVQESYTSDVIGFTQDSTAFSLANSGVLYWGRSPYTHFTATPTNTFPEAVAPPDTEERFWYRLRITGSGSIALVRVLPSLFNTYATPTDVANFLQVPEFSERTSPDIDTVRRFIADAEDDVDNWTRKSWRLKSVYFESYDFNPNGFYLLHRPVRFVSQLRIWNGNTFDVMVQGRGKDYWVERRLGQVVFTIPSFRMRFYSHVLTRYMRQPGSIQVDYTYGRDFDVDQYREMVHGIVRRKAAANLIEQADWTGLFTSGGNLDLVPKPEKVRAWKEEAQQKMDELRGLVTV